MLLMTADFAVAVPKITEGRSPMGNGLFQDLRCGFF